MVVVVAPEPQHWVRTAAVAAVLALLLKVPGYLRGGGELQPLGLPALPG